MKHSILIDFRLEIKQDDFRKFIHLPNEAFKKGVFGRMEHPGEEWTEAWERKKEAEDAFLNRMATLGLMEYFVTSWGMEEDAYCLTPLGKWIRETYSA